MKKKSQRECAKERLAEAWKEITGVEFEMQREYLFWPGRRFRLDFARPEWKLAVEVEGVVWGGQGRHQTPQGMESDCEKYNELEILGWTLLRFTTDMIRKKPHECVDTLIRGIESASLRHTTISQSPWKEDDPDTSSASSAESPS